MDFSLFPALMFAALFALIFLGIPVAFALIVVSIVFGLGLFGELAGLQSFRFIQSVASNYVLSAIPLFIFMGAMLERSGIAERLYHAMRVLLGRLPGGLAVATIAMATIFAAGTGIVGAVEALIGLMAIPPMTRMAYNRDLIAGTICAGGSLGTMIPPSIVVVVYASVAQVSIGKVFAGVLIPALLMVTMFVAYIIIRCIVQPSAGAPLTKEQSAMSAGAKLAMVAGAMAPALLLVTIVIGSILAGIASPTEAAGVGALGTVLLAIAYRTFTVRKFIEAVTQTLSVNAMIMFIIVGGSMFTSIFRASGGQQLVNGLVAYLDLSPSGMIALFLAVLFFLGFILDWVSVVLIAMPIFLPLLNSAAIDPLWFGIMAIIIIQTSYLTPPMAPSIFYLRAISPPEMTYRDMYLGVMPFILCQLIVLALVAAYPPTATYLASLIVGF